MAGEKRESETENTKNKKAVVQGKPLALFSEVYTSLISLVDVETIPEIMNQRSYIAEEVTKESIEKELDFYLPDSSDRLSTKVKILCCQSIFNLKIHNEMFDYSFLTFPALKLLEGHLKYIMKEKSIPLEDNNFSMFVRISTKPKKYVLNSNFTSLFTQKQKNSVEKAYTFYNIHRHTIFHWGQVDGDIVGRDNTIIHDRTDEVHGIITNSLDIVNSYYL